MAVCHRRLAGTYCFVRWGTRNPMSATLVGRLIDDRYQLVAQLGEGGMGEVYRAQEVATERTVAVKFLHSIAVDQESDTRFLREAKLWSTLSHPNIGLFYRYGVWLGERSYIAMEYLPGVTLEEYLHGKGKLPWRETISICLQVCDALAYLHGHDVIHRDLKPSNVILVETPDGIVAKVIDFGLARSTAEDLTQSQSLTASGRLMGSFPYMSPEQCKGTAVDSKVDVYALGCIIFELISGQQVFSADHPMGLVYKHCTESPRDLQQVEPSVPSVLSELVSRLLSKSSAQRPSILETRRQLEVIQEDCQDPRGFRVGASHQRRLATMGSLFLAVLVAGLMFKSFQGHPPRTASAAMPKFADELRLKQSGGPEAIVAVCSKYVDLVLSRKHLDRVGEPDLLLAMSNLLPVLMCTEKYAQAYEVCQSSLVLLNSSPRKVRNGDLRNFIVIHMAECALVLGHAGETEELVSSIGLLQNQKHSHSVLRLLLRGQMTLALMLVEQQRTSDAEIILQQCLANLTDATKFLSARETRTLPISSVEQEVLNKLGTKKQQSVGRSSSDELNAVAQYIHLMLADVYWRMGNQDAARKQIALIGKSELHIGEERGVESLGRFFSFVPIPPYQYFELVSSRCLIDHDVQGAVRMLWKTLAILRARDLDFQSRRIRAKAVSVFNKEGSQPVDFDTDPFSIYEAANKAVQIEQIDTAISRLDRLYMYADSIVALYLHKCQVLKSVNNWEEARKAASIAVSKAGASPAQQRAEAIALLAECLEHNGSHREADAMICQLQRELKRGDLWTYQCPLGVLESIYCGRGDAEALRELYNRIPRTDPRYGSVSGRIGLSLAFALITKGEDEEARRLVLKIRRSPDWSSEPCVVRLAAIYEQMNDLTSLQELYTAISKDPSISPLVRNSIGTELADYLSRKGQDTEADKVIREVRSSSEWLTDSECLGRISNVYERRQDVVALGELYHLIPMNQPRLVSIRLGIGTMFAGDLSAKGQTAASDKLICEIKSVPDWSKDTNCVWRLANIYQSKHDAVALRDLYGVMPQTSPNLCATRLSIAVELADCLSFNKQDREANDLIRQVKSHVDWTNDAHRLWRMSTIYQRRGDVAALKELQCLMPQTSAQFRQVRLDIETMIRSTTKGR